MVKAAAPKSSAQRRVSTLVLASTSVYRKALMETLGAPFEARAPKVDEVKITGGTASNLAMRRAEAKALAVAAASRGALVIGCDQTLSFEGAMFSKVTEPQVAKAQLLQLSGKLHHLHSAVALAYRGSAAVELLASFCVDIPMQMRHLSAREVDTYVATGEWKGSVGSYKIEGGGIHLFAAIGGGTSDIIGLPLLHLLDALRGVGVNLLENRSGPWALTTR